MYDLASRVERGRRIVKLLGLHFGRGKLKQLKVLDVGSSTGIIDNEVAKSVGSVVGCDIDSKGIDFARKNFRRKNLTFKYADAMKLPFATNTFDVVICAQVYEHVPRPDKMFSEIFRVLKPECVCYLAALNKYWVMEPHYDLPFLSWLPKGVANTYVRLFGKARSYYETPLSWWQLRGLTDRFKVIDYTPQVLAAPRKFGYKHASLPRPLAHLTKYFAPTFFWLLVKPKSEV